MLQPAGQIIVIGSGLGGLAAAIALAQEGYRVTIHEKNDRIGGKLNLHQQDGFTFDLGPSILTLPHIFERLFAGSGKSMSDYFSLHPLRPHWRNFFPDGKVIDLYPEPDRMAEECRKAGEAPEDLRRFLEYSGRLYDLVNRGYFEKGLDNSREFARFYGLSAFSGFDLLRTLHGGVKRYLRTPHMRDIFDYFIKYVGSSAFDAPAFMNCIATIQFRYDLWYVDGGLYEIARGLLKRINELGITVQLGSEVVDIPTRDGRATGVTTRDGVFHPADIIVSNMEVIPAYQSLLKEDAAFLKTLRRFQPACSGLIIDLGLDIRYPQLAHHNFFYSANQKKHFRTVFHRRQLPDDPTIYLVAASRTDPTVAPAGCEGLKILPHIPSIDPDAPLTRDDYASCKDRVLAKLERMGLTDLRRHVVVEHFWTPLDIQQHYYSNCGSIYGVVSDRFKNLAFKAPKQSPRYRNLFFVGGSVNPGGGMPMVILSGLNACQRILDWDRPA